MNCLGNDIIELEILNLSPLAIAAMRNTPWTQQLNGNRFAIDLDNNWAESWERLLQQKRSGFSVRSMIENKEHEYIQLCLLDLYMEQLIASDRYELNFDSWSADVWRKVDAILKINNISYKMDFTLSKWTLGKKIDHRSSSNKSDWITHFTINDPIRWLRNHILNEHKWSYDRKPFTDFLRSMEKQPCVDINIYDRITKTMPSVLRILGNKI